MTPGRIVTRFRLPAALGLAAAVLASPALAAGPQFSATYKVADARTSGDSVTLTFSFSLRVAQPTDLVVDAVKLGNPSASDQAYGTFQGGTIRAGGELTGSGSATVPKSIYKKWKAGQPAAIFVRTASEGSDAVWARVDATAAGPVH
jgi:hypothetical protein